MIFLAPPTASLVASFYLDDIAALVERTVDPNGPPGRPLPLAPSLAMGMRFAVLSLVVNIVVLALTLFTGVGLAAFFVLNGYLLGREYFELAAMRHVSAAEARSLFHGHWYEVFLAGVIVSALVAVPVLNLLTPLFATAFLTRVYKRVADHAPIDGLADARRKRVFMFKALVFDVDGTLAETEEGHR